MQDGDVYGTRLFIYPNDAQVDVLYFIMQDIEARLSPQ